MQAPDRRRLFVYILIAGLIPIIADHVRAANTPFTFPEAQSGAWIVDTETERALLVGGAGKLDPAAHIRADSFSKGAATLIIRANTERCRVTAGSAVVELKIDSGIDNYLIIDARKESVSVRFNSTDELDGDRRSAWEAILAGAGTTPLTLTLPGATDATLRYLPPGARSPELFRNVPTRRTESTPNPMPDTPDAPVQPAPQRVAVVPAPAPLPVPKTTSVPSDVPSPTIAGPEAVVRAAASVLSIRAVDEKGRTLSVGTAFLIGKGGKALTSYRVLEGGAGAVIKYESDIIHVDLWAVDPDLDLALIRIRVEDHPNASKLRPLSWSPAAYVPASEAWSLGYAGQKVRSVPSRMDALRNPQSVPDSIRLALPDVRRGEWWMHYTNVDREMAGGPVLDALGRVIGINVRTALGASGASAALGAGDIQRVAADWPGEQLGFEKAWDAAATPPSLGEPPWLDLERNTPATYLSKALLALQRAAACRVCDGTGTKRVKVQVGWQEVVGTLRKPIYEIRNADCLICEGRKLSPDKSWNTAMDRVVESVARLDPDAAEAEEQLRELERTLGIMLKPTSDYVNRNCEYLLDPRRRIREGSPIAGTGRLFEAAAPGGRLLMVHTSTGHDVAVTDPGHHTALIGERILFGGLYAGDIDLGGGRRVPAAQGGFVIPLRPTTTQAAEQP